MFAEEDSSQWLKNQKKRNPHQNQKRQRDCPLQAKIQERPDDCDRQGQFSEVRKKSSGVSSEEIQALKKQITKQKSMVVEASKKVEEVKPSKGGAYVWAMFRGNSSHDFYNGVNTPPVVAV